VAVWTIEKRKDVLALQGIEPDSFVTITIPTDMLNTKVILTPLIYILFMRLCLIDVNSEDSVGQTFVS
jgi:hypothetical protein